MRLSPGISRLLVAAVFIVSVVAGIQTAQYRYSELTLMAFTSYAIPLAEHGISQHAFALFFLISEALIAATFALTGLFIALRGPKTPMAVFAAIALMLYGVTIPPPMHALIVNAPQLAPWVTLERSLGFGLFIVFLYVFPDGRFSTWTVRILSAAVLVWTLLWPFVPAANPYHLRHPWPFIVIASVFASAVAVQLYWFYRVRSPLERQQTKWVVYAVTASVAGDFVTHLPWQIFDLPRGTDLNVLLIHQPFFVAFQLAVPLAIGVSVLYYHLWEIDFVVSRTVLYAMITTAVAVMWEAINITTTKLIEKAMGPQASAFAGGTATVITGFFLKPMYESFKKRVDKHLTPATLDLSDEFPELEPDVRVRLTAPHVVTALVEHTPPLFDAEYGAVYSYRDGRLSLLSSRGPAGEVPEDEIAAGETLATLLQGKAARPAPGDDAPVFVPLVVPRAKKPDLLGVLVLGRREGEKGYSQLEISALEDLGRKAGMALYVSEARAAATAATTAAARA
ncbi:MAG TPA: GAF domain-containing protein [Candidatus Elarobacter sp.]|nr:GAF domain-containing protein [Candidatus Elarobacter sp.]